ncbi:mitochondrial intermembrane space import and assembly protein 40-B-like [Amphibalanus amphitrite]|uniref:mitochondrial intermembrane space import and assembly protein 40-B-like n=1 Tax=Amphibalanus amphitrite TaxID=1232801 RepID=UPI001C8FE913|nr:mitochondrial intermembrane space import and assembly protein 40-B-like [Amphibalanus amphitrite]
MSYCREDGKDKVIFLTKEDYEKPSTIELEEEEQPAGLIGPDGEINWNCPCLGGMATGPCGVEFREAFSCFHYSKAEPRGSDCYEPFQKMHECMQSYPQLYGTSEEDDKEFQEKMQKAEAESAAAAAESAAVEAGAAQAETPPSGAAEAS